MSNRFLGLCLAFLFLSNIFFFSLIWDNNPIEYPDILLGKFLNQSTHLLLFFYLLFKKNINLREPLNISILLYLSIEFLNEIYNYYHIEQDTVIVDTMIVLSQRIILIIIFLKLGASLVSVIRTKNFLNIGFSTLMIYFASFFLSDSNSVTLLFFMSFLILFIMVILGSNLDIKMFHEIGIGALFIAIGDFAFMLSGYYNNELWKHLYMIPRLLIHVGELLIFYKIFEKYKIPKLPNGF